MTATVFRGRHERLLAWQHAMSLMVECYGVAKLLPVEERFALADQIRRCAVSVPANIAEGCGRTTTPDRMRFLTIARASLCELQTLLAATQRLGYCDESVLAPAAESLGHAARLVSGLRRSIAARAPASD